MILVDTNILIYYCDTASRYHTRVSQYFKECILQKKELVVAQQNVVEFASVVTNTKLMKSAVTQRELAKNIDAVQNSRYLATICPNPKTMDYFNSLIQKYAAKNTRHIFDLYLVATMLSNKIDTIVTLNKKDFEHIKEINIVNP